MNKQQRILVDLRIAMNNGYCGIAKESRLVFKMLSQARTHQIEGLLASANEGTVFSSYKKMKLQAEAVAQTNRFFHEALGHDLLVKAKLLKSLKLSKLYALKKQQFDLHAIDPLFQNTIWRNVFDKTLGSEDREQLLQSAFHYTSLTDLHVRVNAYFKKQLVLNTTGYDFALFLEPTTVAVSPGTTKLVRYYDTIPVTEPDFANSHYSHGAINKLQFSAADSYFVCISEPTRQALLQLRPELETKAFTIPCALSSNYKKVNNPETLRQILVSRFSGLIVKPEYLGAIRKQILQAPKFDYIFNLATFDPKKNHVTLVKAWEKLNYQNPNPVKLVIAANRGWFSEEAQDLMRPHIEMGNIIHIENVSAEDLCYLFSHAKAFVFPSYAEGFGLPPLEAIQCECPTIVSDIPAHRWVLGEASLYCNPYDADSLRDAMAKLVYLPGADELRQNLAGKGLEQIKRYTDEVLSAQWVGVFDKVRALTS